MAEGADGGAELMEEPSWRSHTDGADGGVVLKALSGGGAGGGPAW